MTPDRGTNLTGALYMTLSMAAFTLNDACMKLAAESLPLFQIVFLRGVLTTALMAGVIAMMGKLTLRIPRGDRMRVAWRCIFEIATLVAFLNALIRMPIANASAILAAVPLAVTLAAAVLYREPLGWRRLTAVGAGFVGVLMIVQPGLDGFNAAALLALLAVGFITGRDMVTRRFSESVPTMTVALLTAASITLFGAAASLTETWGPVGPREAGLIALASVFIIGGYVFSVLVIRVSEVGFTAPFRYTALPFALILGVLVFQEWPNTLALAGSALIVATGVYTLWREDRLRRRAKAAAARR